MKRAGRDPQGPPPELQGTPPEQLQSTEYVYGGKDRMDGAADHVRYVRSKAGYKLIRNFRPELPAGGRVDYRSPVD